VRWNAFPPERPATSDAGVYDSKFPPGRNKNPHLRGNLRTLADLLKTTAGCERAENVVFPANLAADLMLAIGGRIGLPCAETDKC
jgi:hypothetical protein